MATTVSPDRRRGKGTAAGGVPGSVDPHIRSDRTSKHNKPRLGFKAFAENLYCRFEDDEVPAMGAQLTYYLILSFFPFLIFVIAILSFTSFTAEDAINSLTQVMPELSIKAIADAFTEIQKSRSGSLLSIGLVAAVWSASNGINAVMRSLNKAYDVEEKRPFWQARGLSIIATLVMAIVILSSFIMLVFGKIIGNAAYSLFHLPGKFETVWTIAQYIIPLIVITAVFTLLYRYLPNLRLKFKEVLPGAVFATLGWIVTSLLFSFYVNNFGNYTKTYGSIGGIIVLLTWLYLSSIILLLGGEINATLHFDRNGMTKEPCKKFSLSLSFGKKKKHMTEEQTKPEKGCYEDKSKPLYP
jgi:membrane protein